MSHILIVGQKFSTLVAYLEAHGHTYTLLQDRLKTKFPDKRFKHRVVADFSSKETLFAAVDAIKNPIDAVLTTYENYVLPSAWIAEYLNLPGLPVPAAEACTDKSLMRSLFLASPEKISPEFAEVTNEEQLVEFAKSHDFPLILKPANLAKSLLVTKSSTLEELVAAYRHSMELLTDTYSKYAPNREPKLIVEEFLEGSIHSVDAFVDKDGTPHVLDQIVDYQTGYDIGYDDNFHYSRILPSTLSSEEQRAFKHCAEAGIRALGMKSTPAHVEIIMTEHGPRIVEIGARNGGYRERMHQAANGIDITGAAVATALGQPVQITATRNNPIAVLELFPKEPGYYQAISHEEDLRNLSSLSYLSIKATEGQFIGKAADGHKMAAVVIITNADQATFARDLAYINEHCHVVTTNS